MNKIILKKSIISAVAIGLFAIGSIALADTIGGNLSTGLGGAVGNGVIGVVISPPTANPPAGIYPSAQSVTLTADGSLSIHYSTDGSSPTCSSPNTYSGAISVNVSEVIEARSCYPNSASSTVASFQYGINPGSGSIGGSLSSGGGSPGGGGGSYSSGGSSGGTTVGIADFVLLMANWGQTGLNNPADFNRDGNVGIQDFIWLMANWTK